MKVLLTERAIKDLIRIGRFIGQDSPSRAALFVAELRRRCLDLGDSPAAYPLLPGHEARGIRRRPHRNYLIFYRIDARADRIEVLHILHGAQDYEHILLADQ